MQTNDSLPHAGAKVQSVTGPLPGKPGQVKVAGGQVVSALQAVVVATEGPAARALLGDALTALDSKTQEGVGTANLYFRSELCLRASPLQPTVPICCLTMPSDSNSCSTANTKFSLA